MRDFRKEIHGSTELSECAGCYRSEKRGFESKRYKENFKTVIFTDPIHFEKSYSQSTGFNKFQQSLSNDGDTDLIPVDWHVDFGNECNLACKMCRPLESSRIGVLYKKWGILPKGIPVIKDWTKDIDSWNNFMSSLEATPNLNRFHAMGGEPLMSKRFLNLIDYFIETGRNKKLSLSFVTNGTLITDELVEKLKTFRSCDIEVSLESFGSTNDYIRQGSDYKQLNERINYLLTQCSDTFKLVMRVVPQLLNITSYHKYLRWCWDNKVAFESLPLYNPAYLRIQVLPVNIKNTLLGNYLLLKTDLEKALESKVIALRGGRDSSKIEHTLLIEVNGIITMLTETTADNIEQDRIELIHWLKKWDDEFNLNALDY